MILAEHDFEPVRGLPGRLPDGERLLWQGAPSWRLLARRGLHLPMIAVYFGIVIAARAVAMALRGETPAAVALDALWFLLPSLAVLGMGAAFAWGVARTTVYSITNRRLVMRFGIGLSVTANLPFSRIEEASAKVLADGSGDVSLRLQRGSRVSWLFFWPHVRGWRVRQPQPTLRALPDAEVAARILARALSGEADLSVAAATIRSASGAAPDAQTAAA